MITDCDYKFITQREKELMATIEVSINTDELILKSNKSEFKVSLTSEKKSLVKVSVWEDTCDANDEGDAISSWLTNELGKYNGKSLRLVRFSNQGQRTVPEEYLNGIDAESAFSDQFPYLITTWESLTKLNNGLKEKGSQEVTMNRFRPNIVLKGLSDIEKKTSYDLVCESSNYKFGLRKPCKRCKVTTINQNTGKIIDPKEPLSSLVSLGFSDELYGAFFGQNAILLSNEDCVLKIGDQIKIT
tara:strand:- start:128 stop:859 length:732 start_codon:yes stop_codon:yes gene_type:complete